jgi:3-hydroxybutyryl-CoA dehydratase
MMTNRSDHALPEKLELGQLQTTPEMTEQYAALSGDYNPIHLDADFAAATAFGAPIIHGAMTLNLLVEGLHSAFGDNFPEARIDIRFVRSVHVGRTIAAGCTLTDRATRSYEIFVETETGERAVQGTCSFGPPTSATAQERADTNKPKDIT